MSNSTPLHMAGKALDPIHFTSRVAAAARDEDRPNEHAQSESDKDHAEGRHRTRSQAENTRKIEDVVTLSEDAQKWLSGAASGSGDRDVQGEVRRFYSSLPRTLPQVESANYPEGSRVLSRYDLMSLAAQQSTNTCPAPFFMDDVVSLSDPMRGDFDAIVCTLQDRFPPRNMAQSLRLEMLALGLLRLKKVVRNQFIMVEGCAGKDSGRGSAQRVPPGNEIQLAIQNALSSARKGEYFKLGDDECDLLARRVAMHAALDAGALGIEGLADKHAVHKILSNQEALEGMQRVELIKILSSLLSQARAPASDPDPEQPVAVRAESSVADIQALHSIEKSLAEDVYQNMNEIIRQNRHAAWGQFPFA